MLFLILFFFILLPPQIVQCAVHKVAIHSTSPPVSLGFPTLHSLDAWRCITPHFCGLSVFAPRQQFHYRNDGLCSLLLHCAYRFLFTRMHPCLLASPRLLARSTTTTPSRQRGFLVFPPPPQSRSISLHTLHLRDDLSVPTSPLSNNPFAVRLVPFSCGAAAGRAIRHILSFPFASLLPLTQDCIFVCGTYIFIDE